MEELHSAEAGTLPLEMSIKFLKQFLYFEFYMLCLRIIIIAYDKLLLMQKYYITLSYKQLLCILLYISWFLLSLKVIFQTIQYFLKVLLSNIPMLEWRKPKIVLY